jgi:hypothetical protein
VVYGPDGTPPSARGERIFAALSFKSILDLLKNNGAGNASTLSVIDEAMIFAADGIRKMLS